MKEFFQKNKILSSKYLYWIVFFVFLIWMLFFDMNSWTNHKRLNKEIESLKKQKEFLQREIERDKKSLEQINTIEGKEKFGREHYYLKHDNEDIYIIEYDTIR